MCFHNHVYDNASTNIDFINNQIAFSDSSIHSGNAIGPNISTKGVESSIANLRKTNVLLSSFYIAAPIVYIKYLYQCMSLYDCQLLDVTDRYTNKILRELA